MTKATLAIDRVLTIPLREVSGICLHRPATGPPLLVAIGDASMELAWATLVVGDEPEWSVADLSEFGSRAPTGDRSSRPSPRMLVDGCSSSVSTPPSCSSWTQRERRLLATVELTVRDEDGLHRPRERDAASLGEAVLPLRDGRLLVCKEKDPPLLVEFGPVGETALGIDPSASWARTSRGPSQAVRRPDWKPWRGGP